MQEGKITEEEIEFLKDEEGNLDNDKLIEFLTGEARADILERFYNMDNINIELLHDLSEQVVEHFELEEPPQEIVDEFLENEMGD